MRFARTALLAVAAALGAPTGAQADPTATIVLDVSTFRNQKGVLGCQLYDTSAGFPDKWPSNPNLQKHVPVSGTTTSCTFDQMPPGTYAAAVIHDENSNGKLDTNFLGIPTEGYGISNNHTHALSRPTWDESKFVVAGGTTVTLRVALRY
ncbi:MAG TPA: DUF2141 domain-containing protein [Polyangiaceae bacterium]|nr:DUF2141 domain-containing protein [Polyangiaceae bacterium]